MGSVFCLENDIKIRNVKSVWDNIMLLDKPVNIDFHNVESLDGAGFQLVVYIISISKSFPNEYLVNDISEYIKNRLEFHRINYTQGDV
ncbi:MAG: hypothetical protein OCD02_00675 [Spirochaetaceae bacterium]